MNNISFKKPIKHWLLEWCPKNKWKLFLSCFGLSRYTLLGRDLELSAVRLLRAGIIWCDSVHWSMLGFWKTKFPKYKYLNTSPPPVSPPPFCLLPVHLIFWAQISVVWDPTDWTFTTSSWAFIFSEEEGREVNHLGNSYVQTQNGIQEIWVLHGKSEGVTPQN